MAERFELVPQYGFVQTFDGEPITGMRQFNGKLLVFTRTAVYELRPLTPRERWWLRVKKVARRLRFW